MSIGDKAKNKAEEATGQAKETTGKATGNRDLKAEGKADKPMPTPSRPARRSRTLPRSQGRLQELTSQVWARIPPREGAAPFCMPLSRAEACGPV